MSRITGVVGALLLVASAQPIFAKQPMSRSTLVAATRPVYDVFNGYITMAADQMPEADYNFRATPEVRSFGELIGHIANSNYQFCSVALKERSPMSEDLERRTTKASLVQALRASFTYCDRVYNEISDAAANEMVDMFGGQTARIGVVAFNAGHNAEHYGNIVTYMRLKGMVPPSSQGGP